MADPVSNGQGAVTILDVLGVHICRRAILDQMNITDIVRSERVSRRWREGVQQYLQQICRRLTLNMSPDHFLAFQPDRQTLNVSQDCNLSGLCKLVERFGPSIIKLSATRQEEEFYESVALNCPNLRYLELKYITMGGCNVSDVKLGELLCQDKELEEIKIVKCDGLTGKFLGAVKPDSFKSLTLIACRSFHVQQLRFATSQLQNVTKLTLNLNRPDVFKNVHALLDVMPNLEDLSICDVMHIWTGSAQFMYSVRLLNNLKRLDLSNNRNVDDALLETLSRNCKKLEYLNIVNSWVKAPARGLAALVLRPPPAAAALSMGFVHNLPIDAFIMCYCPLFREMENYGCSKLTPELWADAQRIAWEQRIPIELRLGRLDKTADSELKIILIEPSAPRNSTSGDYMVQVNPAT